MPLHNTFVRLTRDKRLKVVVVGNSVTAGNLDGPGPNPSFYVALEGWLRSHFPDARIEVIPKIIFAIGSEVQLFRMDERVIAEKPDLVLMEFCAANTAANGGWGEKGHEVTEASAEGYLRRLRLQLPFADAILQMGLFVSILEQRRRGITPSAVTFQRALAKHYECALADAQEALVRRMLGAGEPWETYMDDGIHPNAKGYKIYSRVLIDRMKREYSLFDPSLPLRPHVFPAKTLHPDPWLFPRLIPAWWAETSGFTLRESGAVKYLSASGPGPSGTYKPPAPGRVVGILMHTPETCGALEVFDGNEWLELSRAEPRLRENDDPENTFYRCMFVASGLPTYMEEVRFRVAEKSLQPPVPFEVRIAAFMVVERPSAIPFTRPPQFP